MQAAVLNRFKELLEIRHVEVPIPGPDDVLVKMIACGVCHTDLHFIRGGKTNLISHRFFFRMLFCE